MNSKTLLALVLAFLFDSRTIAQDKPIPPHEAAAKMTLPEGFKATLFAGEPDVVQPIAFTFDDRGRLWVVECYSYPKWHKDPKDGKDRVLIFEDTDGDGKFDKRTVFADNLSNLSGIQYGFGGIWLCSTPNLLFIPIKEGEDKPAGPPQILLDGWDLKAQHNVFNSLTWGPDGWLYGCSGILNNVKVGAPGTPDKDRVAMNCGVWRYHPTKRTFEAVAHGTTNPWGLDFDEYGEMFITNCVIDHLWHIVPGGHYQRMFGEDINPHTYKLMPSICDHIHWGGGHWTSSRAPTDKKREDDYHVHSEAGGGHAHAGCMIYLGDNWPARYRGGVFMCNLHGNRINHDILERNGSTYVARHGKDFMLANDPWFRGLALQYGPDGGVYVSDWSDTGECHNYQVADQTNGRIYKITYRDVKPWKGDLAKLSDLELAKFQMHKNEWFARHARRLLQERANVKKISGGAYKYMEHMLLAGWVGDETATAANRLRMVWTLESIGLLHANALKVLLGDSQENIRAWAARYALSGGELNEDLGMRLNGSEGETSALVRLHIASSLQRVPPRKREPYSRWLVNRREDQNDALLPLMYWYAIEPEVAEPYLGYEHTPIPLLREHIARRLSRHEDTPFVHILMLRRLTYQDDPVVHRDWLRGIQAGWQGRKRVPLVGEKMRELWEALYPVLIESPLPEVRERALAVAVQFSDQRALKLLNEIVPDRTRMPKERESALKMLVFEQQPNLVSLLITLLDDPAMRRPAVRGLAAFDSKDTPALLLKRYSTWDNDEKVDAIQTLASRPAFALALLNAIAAKQVPRSDVSQVTVRQMLALKNAEIAKRVEEVWGKVGTPSKDKASLIAKYKAALGKETLKTANVTNGRTLYVKHCAACHRMFGEGGDIGPDLTGSQRTNLDYVLENVLDPSAIVPREYQVTIVVTTAGRTLSGIVKKETDAALTVQTQNEVVVVPKGDIESRTQTKTSMMPDGLFEQLRMEEVRDLVGYLSNPERK